MPTRDVPGKIFWRHVWKKEENPMKLIFVSVVSLHKVSDYVPPHPPDHCSS